MAPKKTMHDAYAKVPGDVDPMTKAQIVGKLEHYKMPNLRASHIRRVAQLKADGVDIPEDQLITAEEELDDNNREIDRINSGGLLTKAEENKRTQHAKIDATFQSYHPETEAEYTMNQMWLEHQEEEASERLKNKVVRDKLLAWSMNKARNTSEYLRKQEAMQLAAGLDKYCQDEYEPNARRQQVEKKRGEMHTLPSASAVESGIGDKKELKEPSSNTTSVLARSNSNPVLVVKSPSKKRLTNSNKTPGTPTKGQGSGTSGGMHFRNQLPAHFNSQGRRSNGGGSGEGTPHSKDRSSPGTPLSSLSSGNFELDDITSKGTNGVLRKINSRVDLTASSQGSPMTIEYDGDVQGSQFLKLSDGKHDTNQHFKFQPFYPAIQQQHGISDVATMPAITSTMRQRLFPRGTIAPQPEPLDPEYRQFHKAALDRKPPLPTTLPEKTLNKYASTTKLASLKPTGRAPSVPARPSSAATVPSMGGGLVGSVAMSELRTQQVQEVERIRSLFEQHNIKCSTESLERGLFIPEDKQTIDCVHNLPLPGYRLIRNPLLQLKIKTAKGTKKKKKGKSKGKGSKKKKIKSGSSPKRKK